MAAMSGSVWPMADRLEAAMASGAASRMQRIAERIEILTKEKDNMTKHRDRLNQELAKVTDERDTLKETLASLNAQIEAWKEYHEGAMKQNTELLKRIEQMEECIATLRHRAGLPAGPDEHWEKLVQKRDKLVEQLDTLREQLEFTTRRRDEVVEQAAQLVHTKVRQAACIQRLIDLLKESRFYVNLAINTAPDSSADDIDLLRRIEAEIDL